MKLRVERESILQLVLDSLKEVDGYKALSRFCEFRDGCIRVKNGDMYCLDNFNNVFLVSVGKVSCEMARFFSEKIDFKKGIVVSCKECCFKDDRLDFFVSSHPLPDKNSIRSAEKILEIINGSTENDLVIFLISGGASSLVEKPKIDLNLYRKILEVLLSGDYSIDIVNVVRKGLSEIKGGRLPRKLDATVISFIVSDVIGDDLSVIGSGLTYFDDLEKNRKIFDDFKVKLGLDFIEYDALSKEEFDFSKVKNYVIASNRMLCEEIKKRLEDTGIKVLYIGSRIKGEVKCVSRIVSGIAKDLKYGFISIGVPRALLFGGETTVDLKGHIFSEGGRNQHLALLVAKEMLEVGDYVFMSLATDGKDGNSEFAGAVIDGLLIKDSLEKGYDLDSYINEFNSSSFFREIGGSLRSFDTHTNVADVGLFVLW